MVQRWLYSTNAKDIAVLYFMIALFSGMAGTAMSMIIRLELAAPGSQYLAGNNQLFNVLVVGHAVLMIFFLVMPALIGGFGKNYLNNNYYNLIYNNNNKYYYNLIYNNKYSFKYKYNINKYSYNINIINNKRYINLYNKDKLGPYLAGLIESKGTIIINNNNKPFINIIFNNNNINLLKYLYNILNIGNIHNNNNKYYIWLLLNINDLYIIINLINGYLRLYKYDSFNKLINWINIYNNLNNLLIKDIDNTPLYNNSWLSGFSDINSNFNILLYKKRNNSQIKLIYNLEYKQYILNINNINNLYTFNLIINISLLFNTNLLCKNKIINNKLYYLYLININNNNILNLILLYNYYNKYKLLSINNLNYKYWSIILIYIKDHNNSFLNIECIKLYNKLSININNIDRIIKDYKWEHLINNYYLK